MGDLFAKPKNEVKILFLALKGESKLIQITKSENSNRNLFGLIASPQATSAFYSVKLCSKYSWVNIVK